MTLTVADCAAYIDQVLAGDLSSELTYTTLVNQAGEHLVQMHQWRWLERPQTWLSVRGNVTFTGATVAGTTLTSTGTFADYDFLEGDWVDLTAGAGVTQKRYRITAATDDALTLATAPGNSTGDVGGEVEADAVALPSDFVEMFSYEADQGLTNDLQLTTIQHLQEMRRSEVQVTSRQYWGALTYATPYAGGTPVPRLEIYPHSTSNREDELVINYRGGWFTVDDDSDTLSIPTWCDTLFVQLLRTFAQGYEEYDEGSLAQRLTAMQMSPEFMLAKKRDGQLQPTYGYLRGGAAQQHVRSAHQYLRTTVQGPS